MKEVLKEMMKEKVEELVKEMMHHQSDGGRDRSLYKSTVHGVGRFYTKLHFE